MLDKKEVMLDNYILILNKKEVKLLFVNKKKVKKSRIKALWSSLAF